MKVIAETFAKLILIISELQNIIKDLQSLRKQHTLMLNDLYERVSKLEQIQEKGGTA